VSSATAQGAAGIGCSSARETSRANGHGVGVVGVFGNGAAEDFNANTPLGVDKVVFDVRSPAMTKWLAHAHVTMWERMRYMRSQERSVCATPSKVLFVPVRAPAFAKLCKEACRGNSDERKNRLYRGRSNPRSW
jgi:hypothetical protein